MKEVVKGSFWLRGGFENMMWFWKELEGDRIIQTKPRCIVEKKLANSDTSHWEIELDPTMGPDSSEPSQPGSCPPDFMGTFQFLYKKMTSHFHAAGLVLRNKGCRHRLCDPVSSVVVARGWVYQKVTEENKWYREMVLFWTDILRRKKFSMALNLIKFQSWYMEFSSGIFSRNAHCWSSIGMWCLRLDMIKWLPCTKSPQSKRKQ